MCMTADELTDRMSSYELSERMALARLRNKEQTQAQARAQMARRR